MVPLHLADAFPCDPPPVLLRRPALDETSGPTDEGDDPALVAMHLVDAPEEFAVQGPELLVAQVR